MPRAGQRIAADVDVIEEAELRRLEGGGTSAAAPTASAAIPVPLRTLKGAAREKGYGPRAGRHDGQTNTGDVDCREGKWSDSEAALVWRVFSTQLSDYYPGADEADRLARFFRTGSSSAAAGAEAADSRERREESRARHRVWSSTKELYDRESEARGEPSRKLSAIRNRVLAVHHKRTSARKWTAEDIALLRQLGDADVPWVDVGEELGRSPAACHKQYRHYSTSASLGRFSLDEERRLTRLVEAAVAAMRDVAGAGVGAGLARSDVAAAHQRLPWDAIAEQFPGRSANNLRTAWVGRLAPALLSRPGVGPGEDVALLEALEASGAQDESEVTWETLHHTFSGRLARQRLSVLSKHLGAAAAGAPLDERVSLLLPLLRSQVEVPGAQAVRRAAARSSDGGDAVQEGEKKGEGEEERRAKKEARKEARRLARKAERRAAKKAAALACEAPGGAGKSSKKRKGREASGAGEGGGARKPKRSRAGEGRAKKRWSSGP
ncbi:hypothetical protein EMIHUDRAFT_421212 [Emiliania huxleyi CCMP1516]|uniref:Myb-like domain-containing protein n=2 Tax=Emiliania huxleyi TaxID=2903 RepID=A0A0D3JJC5_EMIH1|nr:hypothetical protein EMIHUDRAFT_424513 [Emiliania huxleyi CCMP1516]XP_005780775.1 hypothetical protein EMIHUDRAFT_421212 [Emiliania huxleyi CCMP1516]EOD23610.1 hypothetical protein EMIHUDRAFT_424513 [Emiliania huxleyi CCMP1516]EOD28346.1 hypothetical protein EMIHUDRAFT_421212 [Emiliania huxleyi CCMP1516]|eukprot:XP_005776039.1 hypothetical protein EMIHUDRAFT_424513 [Emiliania huxleyi CCMP1516]